MGESFFKFFRIIYIGMFLVSCAPAITDAELEAELGKLTPEEQQELVKHLEAKESGALAGQAQLQLTQNVRQTITAKKASPTIMKVSSALTKKAIAKLVATCTDSDGGISFSTKGTLTAPTYYEFDPPKAKPGQTVDECDTFAIGWLKERFCTNTYDECIAQANMLEGENKDKVLSFCEFKKEQESSTEFINYNFTTFIYCGELGPGFTCESGACVQKPYLE